MITCYKEQKKILTDLSESNGQCSSRKYKHLTRHFRGRSIFLVSKKSCHEQKMKVWAGIPFFKFHSRAENKNLLPGWLMPVVCLCNASAVMMRVFISMSVYPVLKNHPSAKRTASSEEYPSLRHVLSCVEFLLNEQNLEREFFSIPIFPSVHENLTFLV